MGQQNRLGRTFALGKGSRRMEQRRVERDARVRAEQSVGDALAGSHLRPGPGPATTASTFAACSAMRVRPRRRRSRRRRPRAAPPPSPRASPRRLAIAMLSPVAMRSLPAPARIAAVAVSSAAPGTSRLPATTRIRPLVSLSPSTTGGSGCAPSADRVEPHRVPAIASGAEVLGAPSASSDAP